VAMWDPHINTYNPYLFLRRMLTSALRVIVKHIKQISFYEKFNMWQCGTHT
jgi:hypothetical protein